MHRAFPGATALAFVASVLLASASTAPCAQEARRLLFVVDNSGSMRANDPQSQLKAAVAGIIQGLRPQDEAGLVVFDGEARLVQPLRPMRQDGAREALLRSVSDIDYSGRSTNMPDAVERALYELKRTPADASRMLVVITDGIVDTGDAARDAARTEWLREDVLPDAAEHDVRIFGVAFTEQADYALLQAMAHATQGGYLRAVTRADVERIFAELETALDRPVQAETPPAAAPAGPPVVPVVPPPVRSPGWVGPLAAVAIALGVLAILLALLRRRQRPEPLAAAGSEADDTPLPEARLRDLTTGEALAISHRVSRIGRAADNEIPVGHATVSGHHARIEFRQGTFHVIDLRSLNGTFVNDKRVEGETVLRNGDLLRFDRHAYEFQVLHEAGESPWSRTLLRMAPETTSERHPDSTTPKQPRFAREGPDGRDDDPEDDEESLRAVRVAGGSGPMRAVEVPTPVRAVREEPFSPPHPEDDAPEAREPAEGEVRCRRHVFTWATQSCSQCGGRWCEKCLRTADGESLCPECW